MRKIGVPKMNNRTGNMEQKFITESGKNGRIIYPTCGRIGCEFFNEKRSIVIKHIEEHQENDT